MNFIASAADRLLGVIVPRATAAAFSCPPGCERYTDGCFPHNGGYYWYDCCKVTKTGGNCNHCGYTVWTC
jgi:hypothetical protein